VVFDALLDGNSSSKNCLYDRDSFVVKCAWLSSYTWYFSCSLSKTIRVLKAATTFAIGIVCSLTTGEIKLCSECLIWTDDNCSNQEHTIVEPAYIAQQVPNSVLRPLLHPSVPVQVQLYRPINFAIVVIVLFVNKLIRLNWSQKWKFLSVKPERVKNVVRKLNLMVLKWHNCSPSNIVLEVAELVISQWEFQGVIRVFKVNEIMTVDNLCSWMIRMTPI